METETLGAKHTDKLFKKYASPPQDPHNVPKMDTMKKSSKQKNAKVITMACKKKN